MLLYIKFPLKLKHVFCFLLKQEKNSNSFGDLWMGMNPAYNNMLPHLYVGCGFSVSDTLFTSQFCVKGKNNTSWFKVLYN